MKLSNSNKFFTHDCEEYLNIKTYFIFCNVVFYYAIDIITTTIYYTNII
jgi:hypothetical protein